MAFYKLPSNSKKLLDEIVQAENPTQLLCDRFKNATQKEDDELRSLIRELTQYGFITVPMWADDVPYHVVVNNLARTYDEQLAEYERQFDKSTSADPDDRAFTFLMLFQQISELKTQFQEIMGFKTIYTNPAFIKWKDDPAQVCQTKKTSSVL